MRTWIAIAVGGALGSMARHVMNQSLSLTTRFPMGIAIVNLTGCFIIGVLAGLLATERIAMTLYWREFVFVGLLGGYTTFSTFGLDTFVLARTHGAMYAMLNVGVQVIGGLLAVAVGYYVAARQI